MYRLGTHQMAVGALLVLSLITSEVRADVQSVDLELNIAIIKNSLGKCEGDPGFEAQADLNGDGCVNVLDVALLEAGTAGVRDDRNSNPLVPHQSRRARAGVSEEIVIEPLTHTLLSRESFSVFFLIRNNTTDLLGYSLDVDIVPPEGAVGSVTANVPTTNFYNGIQNVIAEGGAELHPDFSVILDLGDGGVFVNAITADNSTVIAIDDVNDVLTQVFFDTSADACGDFIMQLGPASALSDGDAFPIPFGFESGMVRVRVADCPADLNCDGTVEAFDLALLLGSWGPNPGDPADLDPDGDVGAFDLALLLGAWGLCP